MKKTTFSLAFINAVFLLFGHCLAQASLEWKYTMHDGEPTYHAQVDIVVDANENQFMLGSDAPPNGSGSWLPAGFLTYKLDSSGNLKWEDLYSTSVLLQPRKIILDKNGNVYVMGQMPHTASPDDSCFIVIRYLPNGSRDWVASYNLGVGTSTTNAPSGAGVYDMAIDANDNIYIAAVRANSPSTPAYPAGDYDCVLVKIDPLTGTTLWTKNYFQGSLAFPLGNINRNFMGGRAIRFDAQNNIYVIAHPTGKKTTSSPSGDNDIRIAKYNGSGTLLKSITYNKYIDISSQKGTNESAASIEIDDAGNIYSLGVIQDTLGSSRTLVLKLTPDLDLIWDKIDDVDISVVLEGPYMAVYKKPGGIAYTSGTTNGIALIRLDADGNVLWKKDSVFTNSFSYQALETDKCNNLYAIGNKVDTIPNSAGSHYPHGVLVKIDHRGSEIWKEQWDTNFDEQENFDRFKLIETGTIYLLAGKHPGPGSGVTWSMVTLKYIQDYSSPPTAGLTVENTCLGTPAEVVNISIGETDGYTVDWGDGSISDDVDNPVHTYSVAGTYVITLSLESNVCGDFSSASKTVKVDGSKPLTKDKVPNIFTPNGDGKNDEFKITTSAISGYEIKIYDRWGAELFGSIDATESWDGKYKGNDLPEGEYFYLIQSKGCMSEKTEKVEGFVTVLK